MSNEFPGSPTNQSQPTVRARSVKCPHCGTHAPWPGNPNRPFCSLTCRLIDLGRWLDGRYRVDGGPAEEFADSPHDVS